MSQLFLGFFQSLFVFLFFLYVCQLTGRLILQRVLSSIPLHDDHSIVIGFFSIVITFSTIAIVIPSNLIVGSIYLTVLGTAFCISLLVFFRKVISIKPRYDLVLLLQIFVFSCLGLALLRYHSSPDNHGLVATVSYLRDNIGFQAVQNDFTETTGAEIPAHLGQRTSILDSTWNIADARLRFTADTLLSVGRLGIALLISTLIIPSNVAFGFAYFVIFIGLFIVWATMRIIQDLQDELQVLLHGSLKPRYKYTDVCIRLFFVFSPLFLVMVLEGTVNQLVLLLAITWQLMIHLKISKLESLSFFRRVLAHLLGLLFTAYCYPHGIPYVLIIFSIGILFEYTRIKSKSILSVLKNVSVVLFITSLPLVILLQHTFFPILRSFLSGISGAPYNLGAVTIFDSIFWATSTIEFERVQLPGTGFGSLKNGFGIAVILCGLLSSVLVLALFKSRAKFTEKLLCVALLSVVLIPLIFYVLRNPQVNSYIYVRYLALYLVITTPFSLSVFRNIVLKNRSMSRNLFLTLLTVLQLSFFTFEGKSFVNKSVPFVNWNGNLSTEIFSDSSVFVTDDPMHSVFSLTNFGKLNYLTDNWNPRLIPGMDNKTFDVYRVTEARGFFDIERVGKITLNHSLDGPINYNEIMKLMQISGL